MRISEAAEAVLKDAGKPLHVREIAAEISRRGLFEFKAKDSSGVVAKALRKKSDGAAEGGDIVFKKTGQGEYGLA